MDKFWDWLPLAISAVMFLAAAAVYIRGSADKGTIESQGRLLETRGLEIEDQGRDLARTKAELVEAKARIVALEAEARVLGGQVHHVEELVDIKQFLVKHHEEMGKKADDQMVALRTIASAVGEP